MLAEGRPLAFALEERAQSDKPHWARGIHGIDLNFGCPSPHIINDGRPASRLLSALGEALAPLAHPAGFRRGLGPAMLNRPQLLRELFEILAQWRGTTSLPVGAIGAKFGAPGVASSRGGTRVCRRKDTQ